MGAADLARLQMPESIRIVLRVIGRFNITSALFYAQGTTNDIITCNDNLIEARKHSDAKNYLSANVPVEAA